MASLNQTTLLGNVGSKPELRYTRNQTAVTEISLAINDRVKSQSGEWVEETTWVSVTLWSRTAEIACEWLDKGSQVLITGRLKFDTWEKDGQKRSKLSVVGDKMVMVGAKGEGQASAAKPSAGQSSPSSHSEPVEDDIPF